MWEWVEDIYRRYPKTPGQPLVDYVVNQGEGQRSARGGAWGEKNITRATCNYRLHFSPKRGESNRWNSDVAGVRVVFAPR